MTLHRLLRHYSQSNFWKNIHFWENYAFNAVYVFLQLWPYEL